MACLYGHVEVARYLLDCGARLDAPQSVRERSARRPEVLVLLPP